MSSAIARNIFRMFSACCCSWLWVLNLDSLVTPSTRWATSGPNRSSTSARLYSVSSGTSCRSAAVDGDRVDAEVGQDLRRRDRVGDVRLARGADLARVGLDGEVERALDRLEVGLRVLAMELGQERGPQPVQVPGGRLGPPTASRGASALARGARAVLAAGGVSSGTSGSRTTGSAMRGVYPGPRARSVRPRSGATRRSLARQPSRLTARSPVSSRSPAAVTTRVGQPERDVHAARGAA